MMNRTISWFVLLLILFSVTIFLSRTFSNSETENCSENSMITNNAHDFFYEMSKEDFYKLCKNIKGVKLGDNVEAVTSLIGPPTYDQKLSDKKGNFVVRVLSYYIKIWEENLVNDKYDKLVRLEFDDKDRLSRIISNVSCVKSLP